MIIIILILIDKWSTNIEGKWSGSTHWCTYGIRSLEPNIWDLVRMYVMYLVGLRDTPLGVGLPQLHESMRVSQDL